MAAAQAGDTAITKILIQFHANVNAVNQYGGTALDVALANGHPDVAAIIKAAGGKGRDQEMRLVRDREEAISRMKLAIDEPRIRVRFPRLECVAETSLTNRMFTVSPGQPKFRSIDYETVKMKLMEGDTTVADWTWSAIFHAGDLTPEIPNFMAAEVSGENLLTKLFGSNAFTPGDLAELALSRIPEVRIGAAANARDQDLLAKLATDDHEPAVRKTAVKNLVDQQLLAKIAISDADSLVRANAIENLNDQSLLTKVAVEALDRGIRLSAVNKLTDKEVLARIAAGEKDSRVRDAALARSVTKP